MTDHLYSFDPGAKYFAYAYWDQARLSRCDRIDARPRTWLGVQPAGSNTAIAVIEVPHRAHSVRTRQKDLFETAIMGGEIGGQFIDPIYCTYQNWARGAPAHIIQLRTEKALTEDEIQLLPRLKKDRDHVIDAIGVGLWYLGRLR